MTYEAAGSRRGEPATACTPSLRIDLGCYVLGALDPAQHERVSRHLRTCAGCQAAYRELAALPALLARLTEAEATTGQEPPARRTRPDPSGPSGCRARRRTKPAEQRNTRP